MSSNRKIEIFSAGCPLCEQAVVLVKDIACDSCDVEVLDMRQPQVAAKAVEYGVQRIPSVVVDGKLAGCCINKGIDEATLRAEGIGVSKA